MTIDRTYDSLDTKQMLLEFKKKVVTTKLCVFDIADDVSMLKLLLKNNTISSTHNGTIMLEFCSKILSKLNENTQQLSKLETTINDNIQKYS